MKPRRSRKQILIWTIVLTVMAAALTVLWNIVLVGDHLRVQEMTAHAADFNNWDLSVRWFLIPLGTLFLVAIVIGLLMLGLKLYREVDYSQRQSNFIAGITHELRSPLTGIRLNAETLLRREMDAEDKERFLEGIISEVDRLGRLIDNILSAGKIDLKGFDMEARQASLSSLIHNFYQSRNTTMSARGGDWSVSVLKDSLVLVDPIALNIVLDNLVENAVKYSEKDKEIVLEVSQDHDWGVIRVLDKGIGLSSEDRPHLKERFYRGKHQPRLRVPGTGLGLFLVEHIVKRLDGQFTLSSPGVGMGTTAEIRLPLVALGRQPVPGVA